MGHYATMLQRELPNQARPSFRLNLAAAFCGGLTLALSGLGFLAGLSGWLFLTRIMPGRVPMALSTALLFCLSGVSLILMSRPSGIGRWAWVSLILSVLVLYGGFEDLGEFLLGLDPDWDILDRLGQAVQDILHIPHTPMSPVSSVLFAASGLALCLLTPFPVRSLWVDRARNLAGLFGGTVFLVGLTLLLAYLYGSPFLYGTATVPVAVTTATGFLILGAGIVCAAGERALPLRPFLGNSTQARLLRVFPPILFVITLAHPLFTRVFLGTFEINDALVHSIWGALFSSLTAVLVIQVGRVIGGGLDRAERIRGQAEEALHLSFLDIRRQRAESEALRQAVSLVLSTQDFPKAARHIFEACRELIGARAGYVALMSVDGVENEVLFLSPGGLPCTVDPALPMPLRGLLVEAYRTGATVYENNFPASPWAENVPEGHAALDNVLFAPLMLGGRAVGVIGLANKEGGFDQNDARLAASFAEQAAIALRNSRMLESLTSSEARFRSVAQTAADAIITMDAEGLITFCNEAAVSLFGYPVEEILGRPVTDLMPQEFRAAHQAGLRRFLDTGRATVSWKSMEHVGQKKDGSRFPLELSLTVWQSESGQQFTGIIRDISERKRVEADLQAATSSAESANRAKSEFLANMSHEIRTPLNGVLGMLQLMETTSLDEEQREYILNAVKASKRLTGLLSDILDLSRIEAGRMVLDEAEFEIKSQKDSTLELFALAARQKGLALDFVIDERVPPKLIGDKARLRQILFNLIGNALKFTGQGHIHVRVFPLPTPCQSCLRVLFTVEDTGIGIPDDRLKDVFEPFVQGTQSYVRQHQGAGLGLSIVRKLVKLMGGDLSIDDTEGGGTTVYFSLPFRLPETQAGQTGQDSRSLGPPAGDVLRILFAEDDEVSLQAGKRMLEKAGHVVSVAQNGQEALKLFSGQDFDLVLMDIQMPVLDGVAATRAIRDTASSDGKSHVPIIAMTAYAMIGDREKFLAAGMDGYISKPVDMEKLMAVIETVMAEKGKGKRQ